MALLPASGGEWDPAIYKIGRLYMMEPDDSRDREHNRSNWRFMVMGILALALIGLVIVYKYTGDFSGLATWGIGRQLTPR